MFIEEYGRWLITKDRRNRVLNKAPSTKLLDVTAKACYSQDSIHQLALVCHGEESLTITKALYPSPDLPLKTFYIRSPSLYGNYGSTTYMIENGSMCLYEEILRCMKHEQRDLYEMLILKHPELN